MLRPVPRAYAQPVTENSPGPSAVRVVIADDQRLVRTGFRVILGADGIDVVGEAADGAQAVELAVAMKPDVILSVGGQRLADRGAAR